MAVFDEVPVTPENPLENLVGEGKKFKSVEDLAKSKIEADNFIETLKTENAQFKAQLAERVSLEEAIKALQTPKAPPVPNAPTERVEEKVPDLSQRIKAELESVERDRILKNNVETVANKLVEVYGSEEKAKEVVNNLAKELGVSTKWLMDSAAASPKAFFKQVGLDETKTATTPAPRGDVNTEAFRKLNTTQHAPGSYEHIRDTVAGSDVKKMLDPRYLNASMQAALKDPDKFFANQA